ncbi:hypothetical protein YC2023_017587 [Brassica napus]
MDSRNHTSQAVAQFGCPRNLEWIEESVNDFYANIHGRLQRLEDNYLASVQSIDQQRAYAIRAQARELEIVRNSFDNFCQEMIEYTKFNREEEHHRSVDKTTSSAEALSVVLEPVLATKAKAILSTTQKFVGPATPDV